MHNSDYEEKAKLNRYIRKARRVSKIQRRGFWEFDYEEIPILTPEAIPAYLAGAETNFPDIFCWRGDVLSVKKGTSEQVQALLPFAYMRKSGRSSTYFSLLGIPLMEVTPDSNLMKASFWLSIMVSREPDEERDEEQVPPPPPPYLLVARSAENFYVTEGRGPNPEIFTTSEGRTLIVAEGRSGVDAEISHRERQELGAKYNRPAWVDRDITQLAIYETDKYDDVHESHIPMMKEILAAIPPETHLIVPGDGQGLVANMWNGSGTFGDKVTTLKSNSKIVRESAEETVARGRQEAGASPMLMICSYISKFYATPPDDIPALWIDHQLILDRGIRDLERVSEALYAYRVTTDLKIALDRHGRRKWKPYHVPYTRELVKQTELRIVTLSQVALEAFRSIRGLRVHVPKELESYARSSGASVKRLTEETLEEVPLLAVNFSQMVGEGKCYFAPIGRVVRLDDAIRFLVQKRRLYARVVYWVHENESYLVPQSVLREKVWDVIYFSVPDDQTTMVNVQYRKGADSLVLNYDVLPYEMFDGWDPDEAFRRSVEEAEELQELSSIADKHGLPTTPELEELYWKRRPAPGDPRINGW